MMDRAAAIELFEKNIAYWGDEPIAKDVVAADRLAIAALREQEQSKWISVKERLPDKGLDVLLYFGFKYKNQAVGFWIGSEEDNAVFWRAYTDDGFYTDCDYKPTHWMPLPEPPKEG